jgi:hypothetical protein
MKVLVTAGAVYGRLDDNKLVGNRVRGIWACKFAGLLSSKGIDVTLLVPDTMGKLRQIDEMVGHWPSRGSCIKGEDAGEYGGRNKAIKVVFQDGYDSYRDQCWALAPEMDAAIMAAAVVNWIPAEPVTGKMNTKGYEAGDIIQIPFVLAERVIDKMRKLNPKLTLIGCKMLSGSGQEELVDTAYEAVLIRSRCNVVLANDMRAGLRTKYLVYPDRSVQTYDDDFGGLFESLYNVILDEHYWTRNVEVTSEGPSWAALDSARAIFGRIVEKYRDQFKSPTNAYTRVFGSLAVPIDGAGWLCSPREKDGAFTENDAVIVLDIDTDKRRVDVVGEKKRATLNAPLLIRTGRSHTKDGRRMPVLHLHRPLADVPTVPYGPPGTVRDNNREIPGPVFNVKGHGFVKVLNDEDS